MKLRRAGTASILVVVGAVAAALVATPIVLAGPPASTQQLQFVVHPQDAVAGQTITGTDLDNTAAFVTVKLVDTSTEPPTLVTNSSAPVSFSLAPGSPSGDLRVIAQPLVNGFATFPAGSLKINTPNEPFYTDYALVPRTTRGPSVTGPASNPFDVFEAGDTCSGDTCAASIRNGNDAYTVPTVGTLGASRLEGAMPGLSCEALGQMEIFSDTLFVHVTTEQNETDGFEPVFLTSTISRQDMKKATNNGQAHVSWCVGLKDPGPWNFARQDTNGNGSVGEGDLYVGLAPNCPQSSSIDQSDFAPCIVSQSSTGNGGNMTTGWLPGGDPPRRT